MTPKLKTQNISSMSRGNSEYTNVSDAESYGQSLGESCSCYPSCSVCSPESCREDLAISPTYIVVHSPPDARLNGHLDAALRLMRNAALIFRDTAYDLEELVHTIEAARTESGR